MPIMSEEEADVLDELLTKTTPRVNPAVKGITARKGLKCCQLIIFPQNILLLKLSLPVKHRMK